MNKKPLTVYCVKSVRTRSYSGPYSVRMQENTDQNNSEYGHFSRCGGYKFLQLKCLRGSWLRLRPATLLKRNSNTDVFL